MSEEADYGAPKEDTPPAEGSADVKMEVDQGHESAPSNASTLQSEDVTIKRPITGTEKEEDDEEMKEAAWDEDGEDQR